MHAIAKWRVPSLLWLAYAALLHPAGPYVLMLVAVIGLGRASDGSLLSSEDLDILKTVSGYIAVAIENSTARSNHG